MKRSAKRVFALVLGFMLLMLPMTSYAATKVTPEGHGNGYYPYTLKDLGIGEYEFTVKSGETIYVEVYTKVAAQVYIKEDASKTKKQVGPNNSYFAKFNYASTSTTCTVVVAEHKHVWKTNETEGRCSICGKKCKHPSLQLVKYVKGYDNHTVRKKCKTCGLIIDKKEKHTWKISGKGDGNYHDRKCTKCGQVKSVKCTFKKVVSYKQKTAFPTKGQKHNTFYKCSCGYKKAVAESHTFVKDKCTKCGFKRVIPGDVTGMKVVQKTSLQKKSYTFKGHWGVNNQWVPAKTVNYYACEVTFSFNKPANGYRYEIEYSPFVSSIVSGGKTVQTVSTTSNKICVILPSASNTVTFKVTPISSTGNRGATKTIKKVISQ